MTITTSGLPAYPQTKLRIQGTYHAGKVGDVVPPGQPEAVEIEINEPFGEGGDAVAFITALVDSLFRTAPTHVWTADTVTRDSTEVPA